MELELDITESSATATAEKINAFIQECVSPQKDTKIT